MKEYLSHVDVHSRAKAMAAEILKRFPGKQIYSIYPVPRGGVPVAYLLGSFLRVHYASTPDAASFIVDDIIDSGATRNYYQERYPDVPFLALINKQDNSADKELGWIVFPWEHHLEGSIDDTVRRLIQYVGEDPDRGGLQETPRRVAKAWKDWTDGYGKDVASILKVFEDGGERYDEMVLVKDIPFYSHCEHHLAPFFGVAHIAYIPNGKIVGLSKLSRLLDVFAHRLQVQERMTFQVADSIMEHLQPKGAAVSVIARHLCMESRGIFKQGHATTTTALRGVFKQRPEVRAEFLNSIR